MPGSLDKAARIHSVEASKSSFPSITAGRALAPWRRGLLGALTRSDELIEKQYANRPELRPIYDAIIFAAEQCGDLIIQARKTYVSLVAPRRTFARVQPAKSRVDLGLRLESCKPGGRLQPSTIHHTMRVQIALTKRDEVDTEVQSLLERAYLENS